MVNVTETNRKPVIRVSELEDGSGVSHTGELADIDDLPGFSVSDDGTLVVDDPDDVNLGTDLGVSDDGDGSVTINYTGSGGTDTRIDVSDDGTLVLSEPTDVNFGSNLSVIDDGDGSVTVDTTAGSGDIATKTVASSTSSFDADYNCDGTDDHVEINNAISDLPADGGTVILTEGRFNITDTVTASQSNCTLVGQGRGTEIFQDADASINVIETGGDGWTIQNLRVNGDGGNQTDDDNQETQTGIYIQHSQTHVDACNVFDTKYANIRFSGDVDFLSDCLITDCILDTTRGGTSVAENNIAVGRGTGAQDPAKTEILIDGNVMINSAHVGVEIGRNASGVTISDNVIDGSGTTGLNPHEASNVTITGNTIRNISGPGVVMGNMEGMIFSGNIIDGVSEDGLDSPASSSKVAIVGNSTRNIGSSFVGINYDGSDSIIVANASEVSVTGTGNVVQANLSDRPVASGSTTLSSGSSTIDTGVSTGVTATFDLSLGPQTADADVAGDIRADSGTGTYVVDIEETDTSVGDPTVAYDIYRTR